MRDIIASLLSAVEAGVPVAYCRLVETRGSTPQKAGAAMLVFPQGTQVGTLGGGCVEAEVKRRAQIALSSGRPGVYEFQLDHDYGWGDGLICGGRMQIAVHPVIGRTSAELHCATADVSRTTAFNDRLAASPTPPEDSLPNAPDKEYFRTLLSELEAGRGLTEVIQFRPANATEGAATSNDQPDPTVRVATYEFIPTFLLLNEAAELLGALNQPSSLVVAQAATSLVPLIDRPRPYARQGLAFLPLLARARLLIVGGGHVGQAVGNLATELDFETWIVDDRAEYVSAERFPHAAERRSGNLREILTELDITPDTYCLIVTRGHQHDEEALSCLANRGARYVGMIGSRRKIRLIFEDLLLAGYPPEALQQVHAPVGIDIGSQTVAEIAVSICAELVSFRNRQGVVPGRPEPVKFSLSQ